MRPFLLLAALLSLNLSLQAQPVQTYSIEAEFFPEDARLYGYPVANDAFMRAKASMIPGNITGDTTAFYLHGELRIDSILSGGEPIAYDSERVLYRYNYSRVALRTTLQTASIKQGQPLEVHYSGFMNPSKAGSLSNYMRIDKNDGVYLRGYGYSIWFPVFLEPADPPYEADFKRVTVKLPAPYRCVVGGELINESTKKGRYTATWKPGVVDIKQIQCTARKYKTVSGDEITVYHQNNESKANKILQYASNLRDLFHSHLRPVNTTSNLYIIEMPEYGNISSDNVVGISGNLFGNFENSINSKRTIAHELVHPYVTLPVQTDNPFAALVIEGFPSFFQVYALKKTLNPKAYNLKKHMIRVEKSYLQKKQTGRDRRGNELPEEKPILDITYDEVGIYKDYFILSDRVWLFLYDLWQEMGEERYDRFLRELFQWDTIDYHQFEKLVLKYLPGYQEKLDIWLRTTRYPASIRLEARPVQQE
jgi:hypothetical protein